MHDQQVVEQNRRRARSAVVIDREIAALPHNLSAAGIDRGGAGIAECHVDAARLDRRRRRRIRVDRMHLLRPLDAEQQQVVQDFSALEIDGHGRQLAAVVAGRRDPDLAVLNDRRRPGATVDLGLPRDVLLFAPDERQLVALGCGVALRPAELGPLRFQTKRHGSHAHGCPGRAPPQRITSRRARPCRTDSTFRLRQRRRCPDTGTRCWRGRTAHRSGRP